jgi:hypothetical protein
MRDEIRQVVRVWKADLASSFKVDADVLIRRLARETGFVAAVKKWAPDLLEEVRGMADGAGIDFDTMFVLQLPDESYVHGEALARERCSSLGFSRGGGRPACVAQNLDAPAFTDGFQLVLHVKEPGAGREAFVLTQAGCIGLNGLNSHAVGVCCNSLWQLRGGRDGLPVAFVVRGVLQQRSEEEAVAFLRKVTHASGQNYLLGGPAHAFSFECSAGRVSRFQPAGREDVVWHTNHPLANDDYSTAYREALARPAAGPPGSSEVRLRCLEGRLGPQSAGFDLGVVKAALASHDSADHPVCVPRGKKAVFTFASTVMVLAENPEFHVAPGPPDVTGYEVLRFGGPPRTGP